MSEGLEVLELLQQERVAHLELLAILGFLLEPHQQALVLGLLLLEGREQADLLVAEDDDRQPGHGVVFEEAVDGRLVKFTMSPSSTG